MAEQSSRYSRKLSRRDIARWRAIFTSTGYITVARGAARFQEARYQPLIPPRCHKLPACSAAEASRYRRTFRHDDLRDGMKERDATHDDS